MKKIMFNDRFLLTQAVLKGRKTQTRRIIKPQPEYDQNKGLLWKGYYSGIGFDNPKDAYKNFLHNSPYKVGETLAVAQRYSELGSASFDQWEMDTDWFEKGYRNKMFVKPDLMPHHIRITKVRVERLQNISDEDCLKEGIEEIEMVDAPCYVYKNDPVYKTDGYDTPQEAYASLIDGISGKGTWESNPYVFVYEFELIDFQ